jgi:hypothetical protein
LDAPRFASSIATGITAYRPDYPEVREIRSWRSDFELVVVAAYCADPWLGQEINLQRDKLHQRGALWYKKHALAVPNALHLRQRVLVLRTIRPSAATWAFQKNAWHCQHCSFGLAGKMMCSSGFSGTFKDLKRRAQARHVLVRCLVTLAEATAWDSVSFNLITKLPTTRAKFSYNVVVVYRLTKMVHLAACKKTLSATDCPHVYQGVGAVAWHPQESCVCGTHGSRLPCGRRVRHAACQAQDVKCLPS